MPKLTVAFYTADSLRKIAHAIRAHADRIESMASDIEESNIKEPIEIPNRAELERAFEAATAWRTAAEKTIQGLLMDQGTYGSDPQRQSELRAAKRHLAESESA